MVIIIELLTVYLNTALNPTKSKFYWQVENQATMELGRTLRHTNNCHCHWLVQVVHAHSNGAPVTDFALRQNYNQKLIKEAVY